MVGGKFGGTPAVSVSNLCHYPIIPDSSLKALQIFGIKEKDIFFETIKDNEYLKKIDKINKIQILFNKVKYD